MFTITVVYQISVMFWTRSTMNVVGVSAQYFARRTQTIQKVMIFKMVTIPYTHTDIPLNICFQHAAVYILPNVWKNNIRPVEQMLFLLQCSERILVSGGVSGIGGLACWVRWGGEGWVFAREGQLYLRWQREGLDQTWRWISDSLIAYRLEIPPAKNRALHYGQLRSVLLWLLSHSKISATNMWTTYFERWKKKKKRQNIQKRVTFAAITV